MLKKLCFVLCGLVTVVTASFNISYPMLHQDNGDNRVSVCVSKILSRITEFINFTADVSLIGNEDVVIQNLHGIKGVRFVTRTQSWINKEIYNTIYVLNIMDFNDMKKRFNVIMKDNYWTPASSFIIIFNSFEDSLENVTRFLVFNNIYNVSVLRRDANDYTIFTFHSPVHPCKQPPYLIKMTQCSMLDGGSYIFPNIEERNFQGCRLKIAAHSIYPLVNLDNNKSEGLEQQMIQVFSERHNMVIELIEYYKIDKFGRIVENYSSLGILGKVRAGIVEGAIGGYFVDIGAIGKFYFGYPILIDRIVVIMPKAKFYDTWQAVFQKTFYFIMFIFILIITFSVLAYLLALFPSREADPIRDFMIVFGFFLNKITVRKMKKGVPETIIISSLLFSVFIIPYSMQAFLYSVKTHPIKGFEAQISEEINENFQLITPQDWANMPNSQSCPNRLDCLNKVINSKNRMHYTMISETFFEAYKWMLIDEQCSIDVYKLQDTVNIMMRTIYFRLGSVIVKPFDKFLLEFASVGLLKKHWEDFYFNERLKCKYRAKPLHDDLSLIDLYQSFAILIGGYCLSAICFAYEILSKKK